MYFHHLGLVMPLKFLKVGKVFNVRVILSWMNKRGLIILVLGLLVVGFFWFVFGVDEVDEIVRECVKASCCHASECVWEDEAPDCGGVLCTMSCEPGTMDCGAGECGVVDGACGVVWNE